VKGMRGYESPTSHPHSTSQNLHHAAKRPKRSDYLGKKIHLQNTRLCSGCTGLDGDEDGGR
jgi:hypothetical protein